MASVRAAHPGYDLPKLCGGNVLGAAFPPQSRQRKTIKSVCETAGFQRLFENISLS